MCKENQGRDGVGNEVLRWGVLEDIEEKTTYQVKLKEIKRTRRRKIHLSMDKRE